MKIFTSSREFSRVTIEFYTMNTVFKFCYLMDFLPFFIFKFYIFLPLGISKAVIVPSEFVEYKI